MPSRPRKAAAKKKRVGPGAGVGGDTPPATGPTLAGLEPGEKPPEKVAIVAMGASNGAWLQMAGSRGHPKEVVDEVWTINAAAACVKHDRAFVMDDVKYILAEQASRTGKDEKKVAQGVFRWLPEHPGPVYTSTTYPEWPALVEFPVGDVLKTIGGVAYLNNSVAYAVALAIHWGVKELHLYGCDFSYPDQHVSEAGRGCVEFLLGIAVSKGIELMIPNSSTLLDAHVELPKKLYGFHMPVVPEHDPETDTIRLKRMTA